MQKTILVLLYMLVMFRCLAQKDTTGNRVDSFLLRQKGLLGKLARNVMANRNVSSNTPVRNDLLFARYKGKIIRNITIRRLDFGTSIADTSRTFKSSLTRLANEFHHKTREGVIRNNLFFKEGDIFIPYLVADNERHLRDLHYVQDVKIVPRDADPDSVDILIFTKDILSLGGSLEMKSTTKMDAGISEDNLAGTGHRLLLRGFFDNGRNPKFGEGGEYTARNLGGSFIDWRAGYLSFNSNFASGVEDEETMYTGLTRPLVNPYIRFIYSANAAWHITHDQYKSDTLYQTNSRYSYYNYDAWVGWNTGAYKVTANTIKENAFRTLISLRYLQQSFSQVPLKYAAQYNYSYADVKALLASITVFKQDFYKAQYVLGLGLNEDVPEGADLSLITGWTKKSGVPRPYLGIDLERYFFSARESYFNYTLKADAYLSRRTFQDVNVLFNLDYFSRLLRFGARWKQRTFVTASIGHQANRVLNEPLYLQSDFGLREWRNDTAIAGDTRITLKVESVFFTPWNIANFRFAPFVFVNLCRFDPLDPNFPHSHWYNSLGGGVRTRNESLVFQTVELRAFFFPQTNFMDQSWRIEINTNLRFRYNRQFDKRPDFVNINTM